MSLLPASSRSTLTPTVFDIVVVLEVLRWLHILLRILLIGQIDVRIVLFIVSDIAEELVSAVPHPHFFVLHVAASMACD